jgi:hypothetical protein
VVDEPTVSDIVEVPFPVIDAGLKPTVTPVGCPEAESVTAESKPPLTVLVTVVLPELPCTTDTELGDAERLKPEVVVDPASALIRPDPFGLPQPVARS